MTVNRWIAPGETPFGLGEVPTAWAVTLRRLGLDRAAQGSVPVECHWGEGAGCRPVPLRCWRLTEPDTRHVEALAHLAQRITGVGTTGQNLLWPGLAGSGLPFHFSAAMRNLLADIVVRVPELAHIRPEQIHLGVTRCKRRRVGLLARITPLRFPGGSLWRRYGAWQVTLQRYWLRGCELLYLIAFPLPRFLDLPFEEKMVTIFHELCHIAPEFNGDLNRHPGRYCLHTRSKKAYDRRMALLVRAYLQTQPEEGKFAFLRLSARQLLQCFGAIIGEWLPVPRLVHCPVTVAPSAAPAGVLLTTSA